MSGPHKTPDPLFLALILRKGLLPWSKHLEPPRFMGFPFPVCKNEYLDLPSMKAMDASQCKTNSCCSKGRCRKSRRALLPDASVGLQAFEMHLLTNGRRTKGTRGGLWRAYFQLILLSYLQVIRNAGRLKQWLGERYVAVQWRIEKCLERDECDETVLQKCAEGEDLDTLWRPLSNPGIWRSQLKGSVSTC
jgi:hypothetical protein